MTTADRIFELLLLAYPAAFREHYGHEMATVFRDRRRETSLPSARFWIEVVLDVAVSAPMLRLESLSAPFATPIHPKEGTMRTMAILALLVGAAEIVNSSIEGYLGGIVYHGGYSLAGGAAGIIAGALLIASAIAIFRRSPHAAAFAQRAAIICLAVFLVALLRPMFSIFASLIGIGFPIALLLFFCIKGAGQAPTTRMA